MTTPALHVIEHGSGLPLLALHGFPVDHRLMTGCLEPAFGPDDAIRRIYPDLPGLGASPGDGVSSARDMLDRIDAFVDESISDEPFLVVGESYGGYLSRALVQRRREQVRGLALICPAVVAEASGRRVPLRTVRRPDAELVAGLHPDEAAAFTDVAPGLASGDPGAIARVRSAYALDEPLERGEPFTAPTLIVAGRQDWTVGYLDQWSIVEHYPASTFAVLDVAGHNLQFERPRLFGALVRDWLDRVADEPLS